MPLSVGLFGISLNFFTSLLELFVHSTDAAVEKTITENLEPENQEGKLENFKFFKTSVEGWARTECGWIYKTWKKYRILYIRIVKKLKTFR